MATAGMIHHCKRMVVPSRRRKGEDANSLSSGILDDILRRFRLKAELQCFGTTMLFMTRVSDLHVSTNIALPSPGELCREIPEGEAHAALVAESRATISRILSG